MEQTMHLARSGWRPEETDMLWREIQAAAETGAPLRGVFERMGQTLGRKPNSVRNYYYMQLRDQAGDELKRAAPFEVFSEEEVHRLLREVLAARGKGQSVRACVMELSGGDRSRMLRYQNKYRSILRKRPDKILAVCRELEEEGLPSPQPEEMRPRKKEPIPAEPWEGLLSLDDPDVRAAMTAVESLARRACPPGVTQGDRLRVQRDLLLMQLEDLQLAAREIIAGCKNFLGGTAEERSRSLPDFCEALTGQLARLESASG